MSDIKYFTLGDDFNGTSGSVTCAVRVDDDALVVVFRLNNPGEKLDIKSSEKEASLTNPSNTIIRCEKIDGTDEDEVLLKTRLTLLMGFQTSCAPDWARALKFSHLIEE